MKGHSDLAREKPKIIHHPNRKRVGQLTQKQICLKLCVIYITFNVTERKLDSFVSRSSLGNISTSPCLKTTSEKLSTSLNIECISVPSSSNSVSKEEYNNSTCGNLTPDQDSAISTGGTSESQGSNSQGIMSPGGTSESQGSYRQGIITPGGTSESQGSNSQGIMSPFTSSSSEQWDQEDNSQHSARTSSIKVIQVQTVSSEQYPSESSNNKTDHLEKHTLHVISNSRKNEESEEEDVGQGSFDVKYTMTEFVSILVLMFLIYTYLYA